MCITLNKWTLTTWIQEEREFITFRVDFGARSERWMTLPLRDGSVLHWTSLIASNGTVARRKWNESVSQRRVELTHRSCETRYCCCWCSSQSNYHVDSFLSSCWPMIHCIEYSSHCPIIANTLDDLINDRWVNKATPEERTWWLLFVFLAPRRLSMVINVSPCFIRFKRACLVKDSTWDRKRSFSVLKREMIRLASSVKMLVLSEFLLDYG